MASLFGGTKELPKKSFLNQANGGTKSANEIHSYFCTTFNRQEVFTDAGATTIGLRNIGPSHTYVKSGRYCPFTPTALQKVIVVDTGHISLIAVGVAACEV